MIDAPDLKLTDEPAPDWRAEGLLTGRALQVAARLASAGMLAPPAHFQRLRAPAKHVGLGVGTQSSLAVAWLLVARAGLPELSAEQLAGLSRRGHRSGIGLHGSPHGGLIVDGGRSTPSAPLLLARLEFPPEWSIHFLIPDRVQGLHGPEETRAHANLPPIPDDVTNRLCRLVLLGTYAYHPRARPRSLRHRPLRDATGRRALRRARARRDLRQS